MVTIQSGSGNSIIFAFAQAQGKRDNQQDAFDQELAECFLVADGIGGAPFGDRAAQSAIENGLLAVRTLRKKNFSLRAPEHLITKLFTAVGRAVYRDAQGQYQGMGTTLVAAYLSLKYFWIGSIGDSRIYHFHDGNLTQLTTDHQDERGYITRWIGMEKFVTPDQQRGDWIAGDILLLTSDGLQRGLSSDQIAKQLAQIDTTQESLERAAQQLVADSLHASGSDNITICLIKKI